MSENPGRSPLPRTALTAAFLVLALAVGAVFFPTAPQRNLKGVFLVYGAPGCGVGRPQLYAAMTRFLEQTSGHPMAQVVATTRQEFYRRAAEGADFVLCPDGLGLGLADLDFKPLVAGRRSLPANLRPHGVLVYRKSAGWIAEPWRTRPRRTVFGDSLSLVAIDGVGGAAAHKGCSFGPDPYDHGPVLHALRLGAFDYALVRQWDATRFFDAGLLTLSEWGIQNRTAPEPDVVLLAAGGLPLSNRLKWADALARINRENAAGSEIGREVGARLGALGLVGFNLLLEPEFELVRRNFLAHEPGAAK